MKNAGFRSHPLGAAIAMAGLFAVQPAAADSLTFNGMYYSSPDAVNISYSGAPGPVNESVLSGGFRMTNFTPGTPVTFIAWCLDIFDRMASQTYTLKSAESYVPGWSHVPLDMTKVTALERLASNNAVTNAAQSSAFQMAAWEIVDEQSGSYTLSAGNFQASGNTLLAPNTIALANTWLSNLGTAAPTMKLSLWQANTPGSTQDLAVFVPVPEAHPYGLMMAGLGLMGFIARRKMGRAKDAKAHRR